LTFTATKEQNVTYEDDEREEPPRDPFEVDIPAFHLEGRHADEIIGYVREFAHAKQDYNALMQQASFRELRIAISALNDSQVRAVLLRAIASDIARRLDRERFSAWVEAQ
jgi:hypothetical protein